MGKLPASQANPEMVAAFRNEEKKDTRKLLRNYLIICSKSKVYFVPNLFFRLVMYYVAYIGIHRRPRSKLFYADI